MENQTYSIERDNGHVLGCIDLVESPDDGGWYAHQFDFRRTDNSTRSSSKIYRSKEALSAALKSGKHRWGKWE